MVWLLYHGVWPSVDHIFQMSANLNEELLHPVQLVEIGGTEGLADREDLEALQKLRACEVIRSNASHFPCSLLHLLEYLESILELHYFLLKVLLKHM